MRKIPRFHRVIEGPPLEVLTNSTSSREVYRTQVAIDGSLALCNCPGFLIKRECSHQTVALQEWKARIGVQMTSTELVPSANPTLPILVGHPPVALIPTDDELNRMIRLANMLTKARGFAIPAHFDDPRKTAAVIYAGFELGVRPMVALRHMFVVDGKIESSGQLMMGIIMARDRTIRFEWPMAPSDEGAECEMWRGGQVVARGRWTKTEATQSGQLSMRKRKVIASWEKTQSGKNRPIFAKDDRGFDLEEDAPGNWQKYPSRMYAWACVKICARLGAPDILNGVESVAQTSLSGDLLAELEAEAAAPAPVLTDGAAEFEGDEPGETYIWAAPLRERLDRAGITDAEVMAVVEQEGMSLYEAIEDWMFQVEVTDVNARCIELVNHIIAQRKPAQSRFDEAPE